jgi:hypothetical protein
MRARHRGMCVLALLVSAGSLAGSRTAHAESKAIALYVEGPDADAVREVAVAALPPETTLADEHVFHQEFVREGQSKPLGREVDTAAIERMRRAARVMGIAAAVVVRVRRDAGGRHALVLVVPAWNAPSTVDEVVLGGTSHQEDLDAVARALGHTLDAYAGEATTAPSSRPPPAESGALPQPPLTGPPSFYAPAPQASFETDPESSAPASTQTPPATALDQPSGVSMPAHRVATSDLDFALGGDVVGRHFVYRNGIAPQDRTYNLLPALGAGVRVALFPLEHARGPWKDLGLLGEYWQLLSGEDTGGTGSNVRPTSYALGLRGRVHPGTGRFVLGVSVAYAFTAFGASGPQPVELPDVKYRSVRPALDARVAFGNVAVLGAAALHVLLDTPNISTRFYGPSGYGADAELGGAVMIVPGLEVRLTGWYSVYSFTFKPPAGATFGGGSALDETYGARLALALVL